MKPSTSRQQSQMHSSVEVIPANWVQRTFDRCVDLGLFAAIFLVPLLMGGRSAVGQLALVCIAVWTAAVWLLGQLTHSQPKWRWTGLELLVLGAAAVGFVQIMPLPRGVLGTLSPGIGKLLPAWGSSEAASVLPDAWGYLSLAVGDSRSSLVTLLAVATLALVTTQRIESNGDVERLLKWIGLAGIGMAVFALIQFAAGNGKFFWFFEHPYTTTLDRLKGSFTNRNHFAQFLVLAIGPIVWWLTRMLPGSDGRQPSSFRCTPDANSRQHVRLSALLLALAVVVACVFFSRSRGGILAFLVAATVSAVGLYRLRIVSAKLLAALSGTGVLVAILLAVLGTESLFQRLDDWQSDDRLRIWKANLDMAADFPITGAGLGSHAEVYPLYLDQPLDRREYTHAENCYLQLASEAGLPGLCLAMIALAACSFWCLRGMQLSPSPSVAAALAGIAASLAANAAHAFFDFVWYVPGCAVIVAVLGACTARLYQLARHEAAAVLPGTVYGQKRFPRALAAASLMGVACLASWMIGIKAPAARAEPNWNDYLRLTLSSSASANPSENRDDTDELDRLRQKLTALRAAVSANPNDARLQLRMASGYLAWFDIVQQRSENPMSLIQIQDAAWTAGFASVQDMSDWLDRALGANRQYLERALTHARRAVELCPVEGAAYVHLANLTFLLGGGPETQSALLEQALQVRPHEPSVLFALGRHAWMRRDPKSALGFWQAAFQRDQLYEQRIVDTLIDFVPARFLIENLKPSREALERLERRFRTLQRPGDYADVVRALAEASVQDAQRPGNRRPVVAWLSAAKAYAVLEDRKLAQQCFESALSADPNSFHVRRDYGLWLLNQKMYAEAATHLLWATRLRPDDEAVRTAAEQANKSKLRALTQLPNAPSRR